MRIKMKFPLILLIFTAIFWLCPDLAMACDVRQYALGYIKNIHSVVGGTKPKLVVKKGSSSDEYAYYLNKTIYVFKGDYKESCEDSLPMLKSVIAHEYGHHIEKDLRKVSQLRGERLILVAEHSIADQILGGAEYDNEKDLKYSSDYEKIKNYLVKKQNKKLLAETNQRKILFKSKK